jgi:hypothetical protein
MDKPALDRHDRELDRRRGDLTKSVGDFLDLLDQEASGGLEALVYLIGCGLPVFMRLPIEKPDGSPPDNWQVCGGNFANVLRDELRRRSASDFGEEHEEIWCPLKRWPYVEDAFFVLRADVARAYGREGKAEFPWQDNSGSPVCLAVDEEAYPMVEVRAWENAHPLSIGQEAASATSPGQTGEPVAVKGDPVIRRREGLATGRKMGACKRRQIAAERDKNIETMAIDCLTHVNSVHKTAPAITCYLFSNQAPIVKGLSESTVRRKVAAAIGKYRRENPDEPVPAKSR